MAVQVYVNYLAVLAAAVASMVIGFLWYGPLFGKAWIKMMNFFYITIWRCCDLLAL